MSQPATPAALTQPAAAPDPAIEREIAWAVDGALGVLFARLDELRGRRGLSDAAMLGALGGYGCTDLADGYAEWIREGES